MPGGGASTKSSGMREDEAAEAEVEAEDVLAWCACGW